MRQAFSFRNKIHTEFVILILCQLIGSILLAVYNGSVGPIVVNIFLSALVSLIIIGLKKNIYRPINGFFMMYSVGILIAGLVSAYTNELFGIPIVTSDAQTAYNLILNHPNLTLSDFNWFFHIVNSPFSIWVWIKASNFLAWLGFKRGVWIPILVNNLVLGFSAIFLVKTARLLLGKDDFRIKRACYIFVFSGVAWLCCSDVLRDSFAILFNIVFAWSCVKCILKFTPMNFIVVLFFAALIALIMCYYRREAAPMYAVYTLLFFAILALKYRSILGKLLIYVLAMAGGVLVITSLLPTVKTMYLAHHLAKLNTSGLLSDNQSHSLGYSLIIKHGIVAKLFIGPIYILLFPFPFWNGLQLDFYHIVKSYQALYILFMMPALLLGSYQIIKKMKKTSKKESVLYANFFLLIYFLVGLIAVSTTSMESRHFYQFFCIVLLIMIYPDAKNNNIDRAKLHKLFFLWFFTVLMMFALWGFLKLI